MPLPQVRIVALCLSKTASELCNAHDSTCPSPIPYLPHFIWGRCLLQAPAAGGRYVGMDDVNAGVEEHKEAGAMSKWWSGVKSSKMATAVGNNRAVQALTYVSAPRPMTHMGCTCMLESAAA